DRALVALAARLRVVEGAEPFVDLLDLVEHFAIGRLRRVVDESVVAREARRRLARRRTCRSESVRGPPRPLPRRPPRPSPPRAPALSPPRPRAARCPRGWARAAWSASAAPPAARRAGGAGEIPAGARRAGGASGPPPRIDFARVRLAARAGALVRSGQRCAVR